MVVHLRLLSGRARLGSLLRHFSPASDGVCELCHLEVEDIRHFLLPNCPILQDRSRLLLDYMKNILEKSVPCSTILDTIILQAKDNPSIWVQFVLDCSVLPQVIAAGQDDPLVLPLLFKVTRTYCYSLHRTRLKILGRWTA